MDNCLIRYFYTLKHLKISQIFYLLRRYFLINTKAKYVLKNFNKLDYIKFPFKNKEVIFSNDYITFNFLNKEKSFLIDDVDFSFKQYGLLWLYNLNYFNWLMQKELEYNLGLKVLKSYYSNNKNSISYEPYPLSLRVFNIIKFFYQNRKFDRQIIDFIYTDLKYLEKRIEWHLMANHLLENLMSLYVGFEFIGDKKLSNKYFKLLIEQLKEQIFKDGMHFERSPMYTLIMYEKIIDTLNFTKNADKKEELMKYAIQMTKFLLNIRTLNRIPMMQDSTHLTSKSVKDLLIYSKMILKESFPKNKSKLNDSGYRILSNSSGLVLFANVGEINPSYQPGHSHSDELNFELFFKGNPIIVETGTSTYTNNQRRAHERSTLAHNCVSINKMNSSDVWSSFRVGKRAKINLKTDDSMILSASHNGFSGFIINRTWSFVKNTLVIIDSIENFRNSLFDGRGKLHLHPKIKLNKDCIIQITNLKNNKSIDYEVKEFKYAQGYNRLINSKCIEYNITDSVEIKITVP